MRYTTLACDFDGTLAANGQVNDDVLTALGRVRDSGRNLILVTGRILEELIPLFSHIGLFNRVIAEDGCVIYDPESGDLRLLADPPPELLIRELDERHVTPLTSGQVILATWQPNEVAVMEAVRAFGFEHQIIFNRGAVMIVPPGVNKASGLRVALRELGCSPRSTVGVGDAENDHAFLRECEFSVAVNDAVPMIKHHVDWVTQGAGGDGVIELIAELLEDDLKSHEAGQRHPGVRLGQTLSGEALHLAPMRENVLISGPSGSGKSRAMLGVFERAIRLGYQVCIIDPEGDYSDLPIFISVGDEHTVPNVGEVLQLLREPELSVCVNLIALPFASRPSYLADLYERLHRFRTSTGRPHWLVIDEAHHLLPVAPDQNSYAVTRMPSNGLVMVTVHPAFMARPVLSQIGAIIALGPTPEETIAGFCHATSRESTAFSERSSECEDALWWQVDRATIPLWFCLDPTRTQHIRHKRKYATGDVGIVRSFYFRGPESRSNIRAENVLSFASKASTVDDETWMFHLARGDYSRWVADVMSDRDCARAIQRVEASHDLTPADSRRRIIEILLDRYTLPGYY
ncbi:MAG: phosphoglycolate phosphatase [Sphaerobacteraceae bacterium]|nr:MAG: phosphoglycolate phosphatase [Sphaerobacteraceae bacterium]